MFLLLFQSVILGEVPNSVNLSISEHKTKAQLAFNNACHLIIWRVRERDEYMYSNFSDCFMFSQSRIEIFLFREFLTFLWPITRYRLNNPLCLQYHSLNTSYGHFFNCTTFSVEYNHLLIEDTSFVFLSTFRLKLLLPNPNHSFIFFFQDNHTRLLVIQQNHCT